MQYRPEIDGLRAVAVLPVILFHAGFSVFTGGYVGVDVFFVISGYLITSLLIADLEQGNFTIARFYERRARRILPALFVVMFACLPFAYMWMSPSQLEDFSASVVTVILSLSNIFFLSQVDYFAPSAELQPLLHTWSLAIEEQYYFLFPLLLLALHRFRHRVAVIVVIFLILLSFIFSEWAWREDAERSFFFTLSRFWEIGAGTICAFMTIGRAQRSSNLLSTIGLALIICAVFAYNDSTPFPSFYTLVPVVGTMLVILFAAQDTWVARLLSLRGFVGIGLISYSAYLWHQPLFAFARLRSLTEPSNALMATLAVASLLLAWATWHWVEQSFRNRSNPLVVTRRSVFVASGAIGATFLAVGLVGYVTNGLENRTRNGASLAELDMRVVVNHGLHKDCEGAFNSSENCYTSIEPNVLLWGDSFAMHLAQGLIASEPSLKLQQHSMSVCTPVLGMAHVGRGYSEDWAKRCIAFNHQVFNWLLTHDSVDLVVLSSPFAQLLSPSVLLDDGTLLQDPEISFVANAILDTAETIRSTGARVVIVSPTPSSGFNNGQCLMRTVYFGVNEAACDFPLNLDTGPYELLRSVQDDVAVYWLHQNICTNEVCDVIKDGVFIYRDTGHLSKEGSAYLGRQNSWNEEFARIAN